MRTITSGIPRAIHIPGWVTSWPASAGRFRPPTCSRSLAANAVEVEGTVLVQTRSDLEETREFLAIAAEHAFILGVVGWVDLLDPGSPTPRCPAGRARGQEARRHSSPGPRRARSGVAAARRGSARTANVADAGLVYDLLVARASYPLPPRVPARCPTFASCWIISPSRHSPLSTCRRGQRPCASSRAATTWSPPSSPDWSPRPTGSDGPSPTSNPRSTWRSRPSGQCA